MPGVFSRTFVMLVFTVLETQALDLSKLIFRPLKEEKVFMTSLMASMLVAFALAKSKISFAKRRWEMIGSLS